MFTDSLKAQRNSYAHHGARLLFAGPGEHVPQVLFAGPGEHFPQVERVSALSGTDISALNQRVRAGLIGFVPEGVATQIDSEIPSDA